MPVLCTVYNLTNPIIIKQWVNSIIQDQLRHNKMSMISRICIM